MASIRITIETDNAAFDFSRDPHEYGARGWEVARLLRFMAEQFEHTGVAASPIDINGNVCGKVEVTD